MLLLKHTNVFFFLHTGLVLTHQFDTRRNKLPASHFVEWLLKRGRQLLLVRETVNCRITMDELLRSGALCDGWAVSRAGPWCTCAPVRRVGVLLLVKVASSSLSGFLVRSWLIVVWLLYVPLPRARERGLLEPCKRPWLPFGGRREMAATHDGRRRCWLVLFGCTVCVLPVFSGSVLGGYAVHDVGMSTLCTTLR